MNEISFWGEEMVKNNGISMGNSTKNSFFGRHRPVLLKTAAYSKQFYTCSKCNYAYRILSPCFIWRKKVEQEKQERKNSGYRTA